MRFEGITVPGVCKAMGVEPEPRMMWSVGQITVKRWIKIHGTEPPKENRPKTYGPGRHCFAIYPESWRAFIERAIRKHGYEKSRQLELAL
jgi:hypothetical protein